MIKSVAPKFWWITYLMKYDENIFKALSVSKSISEKLFESKGWIFQLD